MHQKVVWIAINLLMDEASQRVQYLAARPGGMPVASVLAFIALQGREKIRPRAPKLTPVALIRRFPSPGHSDLTPSLSALRIVKLD
jgi:hypothetical protein